ncbi:MAG: NAD(P)H-dependent glycerol-3-phosphate dehydrogenase [Oscillospiraceae bacterium]
MKVTVVGCGRWGSFIAWYLDKIGHEVTLYGRDGSANMERIIKERKNELVEFSKSMQLSTSLGCVGGADIIVISINSQNLRSFLLQLKEQDIQNKTIVLCMKGLEVGTGQRLSQIARDNLFLSNPVAVWLGPGHVQEFCRGIPNCMVIDSDDGEAKKRLVEAFSSELIRFYYGTDLIGNEIGGASKNVIGVAAGMLDGLNLSTLKGALMSRGTREIARLIKAMGGNELSAYGLCHLGDYEATVFSPFSHNRSLGEAFVRGEEYGALAEGFYTAKSMMVLKDKYKEELPICTAVYETLYENKNPREVLSSLFMRSLKDEI